MNEVTKNKVINFFGFIFRTIFIIILGYIGYNWVAPGYSIGGVPISQLTLGDIFGQIIAIVIAIGCVSWFFKFPEDEENYKLWASFGGVVLLILLVSVLLSW